MFKKSYVRGVAKALIDTGAVKFANDEQAIEAADAVSEQLPEQPLGEVPPEVTADLAANLVDLSQALQQGADSAAQAAETAAAPAGGDVAKAAAFLRRKLSADTGSTIVGDRPEQENRPENSTNAETKLGAKNRPGGDAYANVGEDGVGRQQASDQGAVASEKKVEGPGEGPANAGSNSTTEAVKGASLRNMIRKLAEGTTIDGSKSFPNATTGELTMETARRPEGYAVKGVDAPGTSDMAAKIRASAVGSEQPHPAQPDHEGGSNTPIEQTSKSAEEDYLRRFRQVGHKYASQLPFYLSQNEKVAAIQYLLSLSPSEQERTISRIAKTAEMPEGLKNYIESKKDGEGEDKEDEEGDKHESKETKEEEKKEEECKDSEKKSSARQKSVLNRLRQLQAR